MQTSACIDCYRYPFGLAQRGISSKALGFGTPENKKKYNGIEYENDLQIEIYDAQFRELDGQIGRWWQIDPKADEEYFESWSPYNNNYDNPISYFDLLGDAPDGWPPKWMRDGLAAIGETVIQAGNTIKDNSHVILDVIGIFDPTGIADGLNALIYLAEGDTKNAKISALSMLPVGDGAKVAKYTEKGVVALEKQAVKKIEKGALSK